METIQYKCKNCGANLLFSPETQDFRCEFCKSIFTQKDLDKTIDSKEDEYFDNMLEYECSSCGAKIVADKNTTATFCCYCNGPVILKGRLQNDYKPDKIIPFVYSKEQALEEYKKWIKFMPFTKRKFTKIEIEDIKGIYVPFWLYHCKYKASYLFKYTHRVSKNKTKRGTIDMEGKYEIKNLPIDGSLENENELWRSIEPFDYDKLVPFSMSYMSGFYADKFDLSEEKADEEAFQRIREATETNLKSKIHYDHVEVSKNNYQMDTIKKEYTLLPMWFMINHYKGKRYYFAMNGSTGKIEGSLPFQHFKAFCCSLLILVVSLLCGRLIDYCLNAFLDLF